MTTSETESLAHGQDRIPGDCPIPRSEVLTGIEFLEGHACYTNADTWYPSWGDDDVLYSPWTDGYVRPGGRDEPFDDAHPGVKCYSIDGPAHTAKTSQARIRGGDPLGLTVEVVGGLVEEAAAPYVGRYPCANLVHDGIWYYGTYLLGNSDPEAYVDVGYDILGGFVGFRTSPDRGLTWALTPHTGHDPLFGEDPSAAPVKLGVPHVVDHGRNNEHAPDGKMYLVGHGSLPGGGRTTFMHGDRIHLARVAPSPETVNDASAYEFFAGHDEDGAERWTRDYDGMAPIVRWDDRLGNVAASYVPGLDRYIMVVTRAVLADEYDTMFLEAPRLTGPWSIVTYLPSFGPYAYFINLPTKFMSQDGARAWLCYSATWRKKEPLRGSAFPVGSTYAMCVQEVRFRTA